MAREKARNRELKRQVEHCRTIRNMVIRSQSGVGACIPLIGATITSMDAVKQRADSEFLQKFYGTPDSTHDGYWGSISLAATVLQSNHDIMAMQSLLEKLTTEREKYIREKVSSSISPHPVLELFENECMAAFLHQQVDAGDELIHNLLEEMLTVKPDEETYKEIFYQVRCANYESSLIGAGVKHESIFQELEGLIAYDKKGWPHWSFELPRDNDKLVLVIILMTHMALGHFIRAKITKKAANKALNYELCVRYGAALLNVGLVGEKIRLAEKPEQSLRLTLAMYTIHIYSRYSAATTFDLVIPGAQESTFSTRALIARCKYQHLNADMEKFYPNMSPEDRRMYRSIWDNLLLLDLVDSLEMGYLSTVRPEDLDASSSTEMNPIREAIRNVHDVVHLLSVLDGEMFDAAILELTKKCASKLQLTFNGFESSVEEDFVKLKSLEQQDYMPEDEAYRVFYGACERTVIRSLIISTLQGMYAMCTRFLDRIGETPEMSERAMMYRLLALKYSALSIGYARELCTVVHDVGNDVENYRSHVNMLIFLHFLKPYDIIGQHRSLLWIGAVVDNYVNLSHEELVSFLVYKKDAQALNMSLLDMLRRMGELDGMPTFADLLNFGIDYDHKNLFKKLGKYMEPKFVVATLSEMTMSMRSLVVTDALNLYFLKTTRTFAIAFRYAALGLNYFFPDAVRACLLEMKSGEREPTPATPSARQTGDFEGTFRDLFEKVLDTSAAQGFEFSQFLGVDLDEFRRWEDSFSESRLTGFP